MTIAKNYESKIEENLKKLSKIKTTQPLATHVYIRRANLDNAIVDIPISGAEFTIRNHPYWILESSNKEMDDKIEKLIIEEDVVIPKKPSEIKKRKPRKKTIKKGSMDFSV